MNFNYNSAENGMNIGRGILAREVLEWALANYEKGGHWIYETMEEDIIEANFATLEEAKEYCFRMQDRMEECQGW